MDKQTESRSQFEAEFRRRHSYIADDLEALFKQYNFGTDEEPDYNYHSLAVRDAWEWWAASRESLVVDLPYAGPAEDEFDYHYNRGVEATADSLRAIGIRIKGEGDES